MSGELKRITYVEDEPDIRALAEMVLTRVGGFDVDLCASGREALERTPRFAPDLILLDVMMPGMHGPEVFRALRAEPALRDTPVVFMTAKDADERAGRLPRAAARPARPLQKAREGNVRLGSLFLD